MLKLQPVVCEYLSLVPVQASKNHETVEMALKWFPNVTRFAKSLRLTNA